MGNGLPKPQYNVTVMLPISSINDPIDNPNINIDTLEKNKCHKIDETTYQDIMSKNSSKSVRLRLLNLSKLAKHGSIPSKIEKILTKKNSNKLTTSQSFTLRLSIFEKTSLTNPETINISEKLSYGEICQASNLILIKKESLKIIRKYNENSNIFFMKSLNQNHRNIVNLTLQNNLNLKCDQKNLKHLKANFDHVCSMIDSLVKRSLYLENSLLLSINILQSNNILLKRQLKELNLKLNATLIRFKCLEIMESREDCSIHRRLIYIEEFKKIKRLQQR